MQAEERIPPEEEEMKYLLAFDPGGTTGWALGMYGHGFPLKFIGGGQIPDGTEGFISWVANALPYDILGAAGVGEGALTIVSESFHIRPAVRNPDVTPLRIEGAMAGLFGWDNVHFQQPARKALVPDDKLREVGLWIPGQRHQMDARIHTLAYLITVGHLPTINMYWPEVK